MVTSEATTVLVIEDEEDIVELLKLAFRRSMPAARLVTADTAEDAIACARARPAAILVDNGIPGMPTGTLVAELRKHTPRSRIVLFSAADPITLRRCAEDLDLPAFSKMELSDLVEFVSKDL